VKTVVADSSILYSFTIAKGSTPYYLEDEQPKFKKEACPQISI
jgi:hypothetical protein